MRFRDKSRPYKQEMNFSKIVPHDDSFERDVDTCGSLIASIRIRSGLSPFGMKMAKTKFSCANAPSSRAKGFDLARRFTGRRDSG